MTKSNTTNLYETVGRMIIDEGMTEEAVAETLGMEVSEVRMEKQIATHVRSGNTSVSLAEAVNMLYGIYVPPRKTAKKVEVDASDRAALNFAKMILQD